MIQDVELLRRYVETNSESAFAELVHAITALAKRLNLTPAAFRKQHTHILGEGRSLNETKTEHGFDCVFLDRTTIPGKAICGVYEDRPIQCRTWPFWPSVVNTRADWERAKKTCPGIDHGTLVPVTQIRIRRDEFAI